MDAPRRILIVKLGAVGDCLHTLIAVRELRRRFPEVRIGWVVETKSREVVAGHPAIDHLHVWDRKRTVAEWKKGNYRAGWQILSAVWQEIRAVGYDTAIDFQNLFKSGLFACRSGAPRRIGFRRCREANFLFTNLRVRPRPEQPHMVRRYLSLLEPLGVTVTDDPPAEPIVVPVDKKKAVDEFFAVRVSAGKTVVAFNPAASLPRKLWPIERFAEVADRLAETFDVLPLLIWGPGEEPLVEAMRGRMKREALVAPPTGIQELAHLLGKCALYVGNDSGPMHLAAAMGAAVVGLFGPTDPRRVAPWTKRSLAVEPFEPFHKRRRLDGITTDQVYRAAATLLERR